jgi:4-hydroxybenzoate polyprenyltransferase
MQQQPYTWYQVRFWRAYLVQMRPYLLFVSGVAGWAGIAAGAREHQDWLVLVATFLPLFLGYGFGQAFTDCFQLDTDRISAPYRPLSKGIVTPRAVGIVSVLGLTIGVALLVYLNPWNVLPGALSVLGLATYTHFKRNYWFAGPPYNAWIVALLPLMGYLSVQREGLWEHLPQIAPLMGLSFVSYANFVLMGYLKDITADRQSGYRTFTVVFGWMPTVRVGHVLALGSAIISALLSYPSPVALLFWLAGTALAIHGQWYAHSTPNRTEANAAVPIAATVRSFILWHLAVIGALQPDWWWGLVVFYGVFEWVLRERPEVGQV